MNGTPVCGFFPHIRNRTTRSMQQEKCRKMAEKTKKKKSRYGFLFKFIFRVLFFVAAVYLVITYVVALHRMTGNNMFPNVKDGDLCIFYRPAKLSLGDAVLYTDENGVRKVGRLVAFPEQEIDFPEEGGYLINGYSPSEQIPYETYKSEKKSVRYPILLGEEEYFIMNDFRQDTADSRENGVVTKDRILGNLVFIFRRRGL